MAGRAEQAARMKSCAGTDWNRAPLVGGPTVWVAIVGSGGTTASLPTNWVSEGFQRGFRGFDSSIILMLRCGIPRPIGIFPESLTQAMLVGEILVGGLGVKDRCPGNPLGASGRAPHWNLPRILNNCGFVFDRRSIDLLTKCIRKASEMRLA